MEGCSVRIIFRIYYDPKLVRSEMANNVLMAVKEDLAG
jgi:hypothetical protein